MPLESNNKSLTLLERLFGVAGILNGLGFSLLLLTLGLFLSRTGSAFAGALMGSALDAGCFLGRLTGIDFCGEPCGSGGGGPREVGGWGMFMAKTAGRKSLNSVTSSVWP